MCTMGTAKLLEGAIWGELFAERKKHGLIAFYFDMFIFLTALELVVSAKGCNKRVD